MADCGPVLQLLSLAGMLAMAWIAILHERRIDRLRAALAALTDPAAPVVVGEDGGS